MGHRFFSLWGAIWSVFTFVAAFADSKDGVAAGVILAWMCFSTYSVLAHIDKRADKDGD